MKKRYKKMIKNIKISLYFMASLFISLNANAQNNLKGKIIDENGESIQNVTIKSGAYSRISDRNGKFSIAFTEGSELSFELTGYINQSLQPKSNDFITVILKEDYFESKTNAAFNIQENYSNTSSISTINNKHINSNPTQILSNSLAGNIAGLTVVQSSGDPVDGFPSMYIRGKRTFGDNTALVFVDGFEANMDYISASEIENISILKDAASLAPFGNRGANGIIWVTTKRGEEGKLRISIETKGGFSKPDGIAPSLDSYDYARFYNEANSNDRGVWTPVYTENELNLYKNGTDLFNYPNVNWNDELIKNIVPYNEQLLSISGGDSIAKYFVFLGYRYTDKIFAERKVESPELSSLKNTGQSERYNFRANLDIKINKVFSSSIRMGGSILDETSPAINNIYGLSSYLPPNTFPVKNPDGSWGGSLLYPTNPVASINSAGARSSNQRWVQSGLTLTQNLNSIIKGLYFQEAIDFSSFFLGRYNQQRDIATYQILDLNAEDPADRYLQIGDNTTFNVSESSRTQWNRRNVLLKAGYKRKFDKFNLNSYLLYLRTKYTQEGVRADINASVSANLHLDMNETYFAQLSLTYNRPDSYSDISNPQFFHAISAGWMLSNTSILKYTSWIDKLKIRASTGVVGNNITGNRPPYVTYYPGGGGYIFGANGNDGQGTLTESRLGNPGLEWEKTYKHNIGLDASFLGSKFIMTFDYFIEKSKGLYSTRSNTLPATIGASLPIENFGEATNSGFEFDATYSNNIGDFNYSFGTQLFYAVSEVDVIDELNSQEYLNKAGHPINQPFGLEAIGFFDSFDEINNANTPIQTFGTVQPGDIKYKDQNNDGFITEDDRIAIGYSEVPELTYAFNLNLRFKDFDLFANLYGVANRSVYLSGDWFYAFRNNSTIPLIATNRWAYYPGQGIDTRATATYPRLTTGDNENNYRRSTFWTKNGNFLRLQNLELGYTLPLNLTKIQLIKNARVYLSGTNLFTWDKIDDYDSEILTGYPLLKSYHIGMKLNF